MPFLIFWSGSFAVPIGDHLRSWDHLRIRAVLFKISDVDEEVKF